MRCRPRVKPLNPRSTISRIRAGSPDWMIGGMYSLRSAPAQNASSPEPVRIATSTASSSRKSLQTSTIPPVDVGVDRVLRLRAVDRHVRDPIALLVQHLV